MGGYLRLKEPSGDGKSLQKLENHNSVFKYSVLMTLRLCGLVFTVRTLPQYLSLCYKIVDTCFCKIKC